MPVGGGVVVVAAAAAAAVVVAATAAAATAASELLRRARDVVRPRAAAAAAAGLRRGGVEKGWKGLLWRMPMHLLFQQAQAAVELADVAIGGGESLCSWENGRRDVW
jgi:hypothetical protein